MYGYVICRYLYSVPTPDDAAIAATLSPHDLQHSNVETFFGSDDSSEGMLQCRPTDKRVLLHISFLISH